MSPVSFAAGTRFLSLIGGHTTTFYDWYADLPPASPQVFGDQTDVPESADWWDASYLIVWGTNLPITRTPDAHFMTEARYRGQKVVVVSPDYSDHVKFADDWLPAQPGTDGALAMAMGHVMLKEFWVDRPRAALRGLRQALHRPAAARRARGARRRARAGPLPDGRRHRRRERARRLEAGRCSTPSRARRRCPTARSASATASEGKGRWNLRPRRARSRCSPLHGRHERGGRGRAAALRRRRRAGRRRRCAAACRRSASAAGS